tara:strand:+ start:942 stop:1079 length:138 start_codon:yes stop_codon:yes gene_type:complete
LGLGHGGSPSVLGILGGSISGVSGGVGGSTDGGGISLVTIKFSGV